MARRYRGRNRRNTYEEPWHDTTRNPRRNAFEKPWNDTTRNPRRNAFEKPWHDTTHNPRKNTFEKPLHDVTRNLRRNTFEFAYLMDKKTIEHINNKGRVMFIICENYARTRNELCQKLLGKYTSGVRCDYQEHRMRNREMLDLRSNEDCEAGAHPIIISMPNNTHITSYLKLAERYGYMAIVSDGSKQFNHQLSNQKDLDPLYLGWFFCSNEKSFLLHKAEEVLGTLLRDGKFCSTFDAYSTEKLLSSYVVVDQPCCVAMYDLECGNSDRMFKFHQNRNVQNAYGKYFELPLVGFVINAAIIIAVVTITKEMKLLMPTHNRPIAKDNNKSLCSFVKYITAKQMHVETMEEQAKYNEDVKLRECSKEVVLDVNTVNFIAVAYTKNFYHVVYLKEFANRIFSSIKNHAGIIEKDEFRMFDDGVKYSRLPNDMWFVPMEKAIFLPALYNAQYI